jgi:hypothetical protein
VRYEFDSSGIIDMLEWFEEGGWNCELELTGRRLFHVVSDGVNRLNSTPRTWTDAQGPSKKSSNEGGEAGH